MMRACGPAAPPIDRAGPEGASARTPQPAAVRPPSGMPLRLELLGSWRLRVDGEQMPLGTNAQRLLAILALRGQCERSQVAGIIWPDCPERFALGSLRATLSRLKRRLDGLVLVHNDCLALHPGLDVDVDELLRIASIALEGGQVRAYAALRILTGGDLLAGWYDDWVLLERERLHHLRLHALEALAQRLIRDGNAAAAVDAGLAAVALDPLRESAHRALIGAHLLEGNRADAVRQFGRLRTVLRDELGVEPARSTAELLRTAGC